MLHRRHRPSGRWAAHHRCPNSPPTLVWYHVILSTYDAWLDGDPRGFRTKNHRKHIEGDYKHPPRPDSYKRRLRRSRKLLVQAPVVLDQQWRPIIGESLVVAFGKLNVGTLAIAVGRQHVHLQIRTPFGKARSIAGIAKNDIFTRPAIERLDGQAVGQAQQSHPNSDAGSPTQGLSVYPEARA